MIRYIPSNFALNLLSQDFLLEISELLYSNDIASKITCYNFLGASLLTFNNDEIISRIRFIIYTNDVQYQIKEDTLSPISDISEKSSLFYQLISEHEKL